MTKRDRKINFQVFGRLQRPETPLPVIPLWRGVNSAPRMTGRQKGKFRPSEPRVACHCAQLPMGAARGVYAASPFAIPQDQAIRLRRFGRGSGRKSALQEQGQATPLCFRPDRQGERLENPEPPKVVPVVKDCQRSNMSLNRKVRRPSKIPTVKGSSNTPTGIK